MDIETLRYRTLLPRLGLAVLTALLSALLLGIGLDPEQDRSVRTLFPVFAVLILLGGALGVLRLGRKTVFIDRAGGRLGVRHPFGKVRWCELTSVALVTSSTAIAGGGGNGVFVRFPYLVLWSRAARARKHSVALQMPPEERETYDRVSEAGPLAPAIMIPLKLLPRRSQDTLFNAVPVHLFLGVDAPEAGGDQ